MPPPPASRRRAGLLVAVALLAGCQQKPVAPVLTTEAVYENSAAGVKFVVPEGWTVYAKANPPPGARLDHPLRLVAYQGAVGDTRADLELYAVDLPDGQELTAYLATHPIGPEKWAAKGKPEPETIHGAEATRYTLSARRGKVEMRREIDAFRRPDRTYLFVLTYPAADTQLREQARRAVESATWR